MIKPVNYTNFTEEIIHIWVKVGDPPYKNENKSLSSWNVTDFRVDEMDI